MSKKVLMTLPVLPLREQSLVLFPETFCEADVGRDISLVALDEANQSKSKFIVIATQKTETEDNPKSLNDLYEVATLAKISTITDIDNLNTGKRVILRGYARFVMKTITVDDCIMAEGYSVEPEITMDPTVQAEVKDIVDIIKEHIPIHDAPNDIPDTPVKLSFFLDAIISQLLPSNSSESITIKRDLLSTVDLRERLRQVREIVITKAKMQQIGYGSGDMDDREMNSVVSEFKQKLITANPPQAAKEAVEQELKRLAITSPNTAEYQVIFNYIDTMLSLPWNKSSEENIDVEKARKILDKNQYGLEKVKERILEFLSVKKLNPDHKGSILCFVGSPGTGKTASGKSIAEAMGREFVRMSVGGVHDESEIRGHRRTYVGALPGRIIQNIKKIGTNNPVFMLDEVDKLSSTFRGDPASALLEVLDPEQNSEFVDNYLNVPFDLSKVTFIATVNDLGPIHPALRDRMEIIELPGYSPSDKVEIAKNYLIPKKKTDNGLDEHKVAISQSAIKRVVEEYTNEPGVRNLERECGTLMRKVAVSIAENKDPINKINNADIPDLLGPPKTFIEKANKKPEVGITTGLAWTASGGTILFVEGILIPGEGKIKLTGNLGKVMQESVSTVFSWVKANAHKYGIDQEKFKQYDLHIHFPQGGIPKDGPSAGVAITSTIVSLYSGMPVNNLVAVTGEVTLRGKVTPIGGVREKVLAAHRAGIKKVVLPKDNKHSLQELPEDVLNEIEFVLVDNLKDGLSHLLVKNQKVDVQKADLVS